MKITIKIEVPKDYGKILHKLCLSNAGARVTKAQIIGWLAGEVRSRIRKDIEAYEALPEVRRKRSRELNNLGPGLAMGAVRCPNCQRLSCNCRTSEKVMAEAAIERGAIPAPGMTRGEQKEIFQLVSDAIVDDKLAACHMEQGDETEQE